MAHELVEEIRVSGKELVERVREILQEGNVRRMVIINSRDETVFELPLALGVIGVGGAFALAPILSSIAAFAFFAKDVRVIVERKPEQENPSIKNELDDPTQARRKKRRSTHTDDPFEIDTDFEIIDP